MIRVAGIEKESIIDGEGLRYVIFTQGCNHNCAGCQNPQTHSFDGGTDMYINDIMKDILSNPLLDGITLSGGDPFFQANECRKLALKAKKEGLNVWAYTGFVFEEFINFIKNDKNDNRINNDMINLLKVVDVVVDGPFILSKKSADSLFRGSYNQRIIDVKQSIKKMRVVEYSII